MNPRAVMKSLAPVRAIRNMSYRVAATLYSLRTNSCERARGKDSIDENLYIKLNYNDETASAIAKVGHQIDLTHFSGLINFSTGQMHLTESGTCERLAKKEGLYEDKLNLARGWHGFTVYYTGHKSKLVEVSPWSGQFGGIPIEHSSVFEGYMKKLFRSLTKDICFWQLKYERALNLDDEMDEKRVLLTRHLSSLQMTLVPKSMTNAELKTLLPKEISSRVFNLPQG
jgi:hypothetical protein